MWSVLIVHEPWLLNHGYWSGGVAETGVLNVHGLRDVQQLQMIGLKHKYEIVRHWLQPVCELRPVQLNVRPGS